MNSQMEKIKALTSAIIRNDYFIFLLTTSIFSLILFFLRVALNEQLDLGNLVPEFLPHHVQLNRTFHIYILPLVSALLAVLVMNYQSKRKSGKPYVVGSRYLIYFISTMIFGHLWIWLIDKPSCVGCSSEDAIESLVWFMGIWPILLIILVVFTFVLSLVVKKKETEFIYKESLGFFVWYLVLLLSSYTIFVIDAWIGSVIGFG